MKFIAINTIKLCNDLSNTTDDNLLIVFAVTKEVFDDSYQVYLRNCDWRVSLGCL